MDVAAGTHMLEYTPGYRAPSLTPGTGADGLDADAASSPPNGTPTSNKEGEAEDESHLSGRHSLASAPHISRWRFAAMMEMTVLVPFGSATADV